MTKFFNYSIKLVIIFSVCLAFLIFSAFWYFSSGLPDYKKLSKYQPPVSSRVYADNGALIAEYAIEKRLFIPYNSIPKKVINSFLSAEDKNFFKHPGVDAKGIVRAMINNLTNIETTSKTRLGKIVDVDIAMESSRLTRSQIITQVATAMLAQANASSSVFLKLLE